MAAVVALAPEIAEAIGIGSEAAAPVAASTAAPASDAAVTGLEKSSFSALIPDKETAKGAVYGAVAEKIFTHAGEIIHGIEEGTEFAYQKVKNGVGEAWSYVKGTPTNPNGISEPIQSSISQASNQTTVPFNRKNYANVPASTYGVAAGINTSPAPRVNKQTMFPY